ncbi:MAG TPA: response regulator [bacterium]|jgi:two-component system chemotaxis response regulator CheY|nr:response regulator [bacterium]
MKALVIDDSKAMRMVLKKMLTEMDFEVSEAENGLVALSLLETGARPELVLVDWNMPEMNGYEFVRAVRSRPEYDDLKLVMVTSETQADGVDRVVEAGADEYVTKPFTRESLAEKLGLLGFPRS